MIICLIFFLVGIVLVGILAASCLNECYRKPTEKEYPDVLKIYDEIKIKNTHNLEKTVEIKNQNRCYLCIYYNPSQSHSRYSGYCSLNNKFIYNISEAFCDLFKSK